MSTAVTFQVDSSRPAEISAKMTWLDRLLDQRAAKADARIAQYVANLPEAVRDRIDPELRRRLKL